MVSLLALVSCAKKVDEDESREEIIIEPLVGIGPVRFGMSKDQVIEHFGQPDKVLAKGTKLNYVSSKGLSFTVDSELGLQEISCWSEGMLPSDVTTFAGTTKEGIGAALRSALLKTRRIRAGYSHNNWYKKRGQATKKLSDFIGSIVQCYE